MASEEEVINWLVEIEGWTKKEAIQYIKSIRLQNKLLNGDKDAKKEAKEFLMARDG